jgi:hypothetical protein
MEPSTLPGSGAQLDRDNPWPGLESYDEASAEFFSGRSVEADDLQRRIVDEPMTILFGKSGLGKTSLLKAGVFPRLRGKGLLPILLRLQVRPGTAPFIEQVRLALFETLRAEEIEHPAPRDGETLWEYLHRTGQEFWTRHNRLVRPVFVFDQFEELFTLGRLVPADVAAFQEDLADLAENRIPAGIARLLENRPATEFGLDLDAMPYKVVIALREDFLADLEGWRLTIPSLRRNRMRLLPMGPEQALQAVCNERTNHLVTEPLARKIVTFLSSGAVPTSGGGAPEDGALTVEPALLSLFCRGVNEHRKQEGKACLDEALLEAGKGTIVADFYRTSLRDQPERVRRFIEENLITEHGFRNSYSVDDAVVHGFVTAKELETLINRHLLRQEHHLGTERIELTHDLLTAAVTEERDERRRAERSERDRRQRRRLKIGIATLALAVLVFGGLAIFAWSLRGAAVIARNEAVDARKAAEENLAKFTKAQGDLETARDRSRSRQLAALADATLNRNPERAVLFALEGVRRADAEDARTALVAAAQYAWPSARLEAEALGGTPKAVALSPDGSQLAVLASSGSDHTITLWDVAVDLRSPVMTRRSKVTASAELAFSPDQKLLATVGKFSIDLHDVKTGDVASVPLAEGAKKVTFSPDGRWLAWAQDDKIQLLGYRDKDAKVATVQVEALAAFAVVADGNRIIAVTDKPLAAHAIDRMPDGNWAPPISLPLENCVKPESVSPGAQYVSATWRAQACISEAMHKGAKFSPRESSGGTRNLEGTQAIIWSAGGHSFAEILLSRDIIVGRSDQFPMQSGSRIRGTYLPDETDWSLLVSISEAGTRVALIDRRAVRVYSLVDHKPFLSRFDSGSVAVAPDGSWIAVARPRAPGEQAATLDVIPIEAAFASGFRSRVRTRIAVEGVGTRITQIYASQSSVVGVMETEPARPGLPQRASTTIVYDATTGKPRFDPLDGGAEVLGAGRELLLVKQGRAPSRVRVVKTSDGSRLAPWEQALAADRQPVFLVAPGRGTLAVLGGQIDNANEANALVYAVRGDSLELSGQVIGLPAALLSDPSRLELADDARSITETRPRPGDKRASTYAWPVASGPELASARPARAVETTVAATSPSGVFEIRQGRDASGLFETRRGHGASTVEKRADSKVLSNVSRPWLNQRFSSDDRWLVAWNKDLNREGVLQVLDLARGETAWDLNSVKVKNVDFEARNTILNVQFADGSTTLIPLDRDLMARFSKWLVPRGLTAPECKRFGLEGEELCRDAPQTPGALSGSPPQ